MAEPRLIPSIDALRQAPAVRDLERQYGAPATVDALRAAAADVRRALSRDEPSDAGGDVAVRIHEIAAARLSTVFGRSLQPVVNATGVILHTNLGRAPLAAAAIDRVVEVARGYSTLEYDLERGERGRRDVHAERLLCRLTGADAAVVVNNNAAATMLMLAALASGGEVIVSRGELVEIGGGFRVPDVMAQSGAILREVGTTNKTRASDYAAAANDRTALILRVHPSNFRVEGFTARPALEELVGVARRLSIPIVEDLGSGYVADPSEAGAPLRGVEPSVQESIAAGVDVCCFSGDKLLGGPQAGIIAGRAPFVDRIRRHPLMRALRVDKMTYAALEATLVEYASGRAASTIPVRRMLTMSPDEIRVRAEALAEIANRLDGWRAEVVPGESAVGGGSAPGIDLPTWLVALSRRDLSAARLERLLRSSTPPVIARIDRDRVVLDLRTVDPSDDAAIRAALETVA